jgi:hypothetical protein
LLQSDRGGRESRWVENVSAKGYHSGGTDLEGTVQWKERKRDRSRI